MSGVSSEALGTARKFLFEIPAKREGLSDGANVAIQMGRLASRTVEIERTRCIHPDRRHENVAEHSLMLAKVARELAVLLHPELDPDLVVSFAILHDDLEAYVGDVPTDMLSNHNQASKDELEAAAIARAKIEFAHMPEYLALLQQYEDGSAPEACFVRAVDKLMVMLIHFPDEGQTLQENYMYEEFLASEEALMERDRYKYGEFEDIWQLRRELGQYLADTYLRNIWRQDKLF